MPAAPSTTPWRTHASAGTIRKVVPTTICLVRGSGRKRLAAPGDPDAASRPRVELDATSGHGRCNLGRAPSRDSRAPRPLREDACPASLVGLVRALSQRASKRQQSRGGSIKRRSLHGGGPSRFSTLMRLSGRSPNGHPLSDGGGSTTFAIFETVKR